MSREVWEEIRRTLAVRDSGILQPPVVYRPDAPEEIFASRQSDFKRDGDQRKANGKEKKKQFADPTSDADQQWQQLRLAAEKLNVCIENCAEWALIPSEEEMRLMSQTMSNLMRLLELRPYVPSPRVLHKTMTLSQLKELDTESRFSSQPLSWMIIDGSEVNLNSSILQSNQRERADELEREGAAAAAQCSTIARTTNDHTGSGSSTIMFRESSSLGWQSISEIEAEVPGGFLEHSSKDLNRLMKGVTLPTLERLFPHAYRFLVNLMETPLFKGKTLGGLKFLWSPDHGSDQQFHTDYEETEASRTYPFWDEENSYTIIIPLRQSCGLWMEWNECSANNEYQLQKSFVEVRCGSALLLSAAQRHAGCAYSTSMNLRLFAFIYSNKLKPKRDKFFFVPITACTPRDGRKKRLASASVAAADEDTEEVGGKGKKKKFKRKPTASTNV